MITRRVGPRWVRWWAKFRQNARQTNMASLFARHPTLLVLRDMAILRVERLFHFRRESVLQLMQPMTNNLVLLSAGGTVTAEDYENVLIPAIEETLRTHDKVRVLFQVDPDTSFTAGAVWDDTKFGLSHFFSFEKFALVSDTEWINNTVKVLGFMMPCPVKLFSQAELGKAKEWISE
jgi:hypothetical protein